LAERVIRAASRRDPADAILRETLKSERGLSREAASCVSRAVFAYYRWRGWLDQHEPLCVQIETALDLAARFSKESRSFSDAEIVARSVPQWVTAEVTLTPAWARSLQAQPKLWLRARPGEAAALATSLGGCHLLSDAVSTEILEYRGPEDLFRTSAFQEGRFEIQDISSQAVGLVCAPQAGETWWDACAGEGGKTLHFSDLMRNKGIIWASDMVAWRLQKLKRRAARAAVFNYRTILWDGRAKLPTRTKFDGVLVDAPCSGIGTWQRNPHARWNTTPEDVNELGALQAELLVNASGAVKSGGKLIYAVCTLARSETVAVIERFEQLRPEFQRLELSNPLAGQRQFVSELWLWPQEFGGNGMFVAAWLRN